MNIKNIEHIVSVLEKLKMPSNPIVRHKLFSIISELKAEKAIQDEIKKSYITPEVVRIETEKQELIKSLHSEHGTISVGEYKLVSISPIQEFMSNNENHPDMMALNKYSEYLNSDYKLKSSLINIDETDDEMFLNLSDEEISHLMSIIQ